MVSSKFKGIAFQNYIGDSDLKTQVRLI